MTPPNGPPRDADELRRRMSQIRRELPKDMERIVTGARQIVDWKQYVRDFPWATTLAAVAVGYWLVPTARPSPRPVEIVGVGTVPPREPPLRQPLPVRRPGLTSDLLTMAGHVLLRTGINYVGQQVGQLLHQQLLNAASPVPQTQATPCPPQATCPPNSNGTRPTTGNARPQPARSHAAATHWPNGSRRGSSDTLGPA